MSDEFNWDNTLKNDDQIQSFVQWFWEHSRKSSILIKALNDSAFRKDYIIKQEFRTCIYGVLIGNTTDKCAYVGENWKLCKIGMTHMHIRGNFSGIRSDRVVKNVNKICKNKVGNVLFELPLEDTDNRLGFKVENWVREETGYLVTQKLANALGLPYPKEWVLMSCEFISQLREKIKKKGKQASTEIFHKFKFNYKDDKHKDLPKKIKNISTHAEVKFEKEKGRLYLEQVPKHNHNKIRTTHNQQNRNRDCEANNKYKIEFECSICQYFKAKEENSVIKHVEEKHSNFAWICSSCGKELPRTNDTHSCTRRITFTSCVVDRITYEKGQAVEDKYKKFLKEVHKKIKSTKRLCSSSSTKDQNPRKRKGSKKGSRKDSEGKRPRSSDQRNEEVAQRSPDLEAAAEQDLRNITNIHKKISPIYSPGKVRLSTPTSGNIFLDDEEVQRMVNELGEEQKPFFADGANSDLDVNFEEATSEKTKLSRPSEDLDLGSPSFPQSESLSSVPVDSTVTDLHTCKPDEIETECSQQSAVVCESSADVCSNEDVEGSVDYTSATTVPVSCTSGTSEPEYIPTPICVLRSRPKPRLPDFYHQRLLEAGTLQSERIILNVGGTTFHTAVPVLTRDTCSLLAAMVSPLSPMQPYKLQGVYHYYLERDPTHFRHILNYLRKGCPQSILSLPKDESSLCELQDEANYYVLRHLELLIEQRIWELYKKKK